jgi:UDP-N-acetylmuramate--alanine ligase
MGPDLRPQGPGPEEFVVVQGVADLVVLTDIYSAGEDAVPGVTVDALADAIRRHLDAPLHLVRDIRQVPSEVVRLAQPGDVVMTLGAGSIGAAAAEIVKALGQADRRAGGA